MRQMPRSLIHTVNLTRWEILQTEILHSTTGEWRAQRRETERDCLTQQGLLGVGRKTHTPPYIFLSFARSTWVLVHQSLIRQAAFSLLPTQVKAARRKNPPETQAEVSKLGPKALCNSGTAASPRRAPSPPTPPGAPGRSACLRHRRLCFEG